MGTQRIILIVLGAVLCLCHVAFGDVIELDATVGQEIRFPMNTPTGATQCLVETNTGFNFSLHPNVDTPMGIVHVFGDALAGNCALTIRSPTIDQNGLWTIRAFTTSSGTEPEAIRYFRLNFGGVDTKEPAVRADVFPSRSMSIFLGNTMSFRLLNHYENLTKCIATSPNDEKFDALNTVNDFSSNIRSFDQCGVVVRVNESHAGSWQLDATVGDDTIGEKHYYGTLQVAVRNPEANDAKPTVEHVRRGASVNVRVGPSEVISCRLTNPSGRNLPLHSGNCLLDIPIVTNIHEGLWTATYSLQGSIDVVQEIIEIVAYDDSPLNATVSTLDNGEVNLLCQVRSYSFSFCHFETPGGEVVNVFEGIGNDRYLYYGQGIQSSSMLTENVHECGITILKPDESDYGAWKCILKTDSGLTGSVLRVPAPEHDVYENLNRSSYAESVHVVKGDSFTVKCSTNAVLRYCWVGSPNGTAYSVSSTGNSPTTLRYDGMGLSLGECGAVIPAAEDTDNGEWKCGMGITNGQEIGSIVPVTVTETLLVADAKNVTVRRRQVQLSCHLNPGYEESIDYCRWIHPSGFGLGQLSNPQRSEYNTDSRCNLEISDVEHTRDIGVWTCVAGLVGSSIEVSATINVLENPRFVRNSSGIFSWYFGLGIGAITVIFAVVLIALVRANLRSKWIPQPPPSYEKSNREFAFPPATTRPAPPSFTPN